MKKAFIALAVAAGSIAAAQAADTTTLYGSLGFSSVVSKADSFTKVVKGLGSNNWDIATTTAKVGVKGTEDLDNGLQAFFKVEVGYGDKGFKPNYGYLGLTGDFGTLTIGKQKSLLKLITDTGLFQEVGVGYNFAGSDASKIIAGYNPGYPGTVSRAISYVTPASSGFQLGASVIADGSNPVSKGADAWEVGAMYNANGWNTGLVYTYVNNPKYDKYDGKNYGAPAKDAKIIGKNGSTQFTGLNIGYSNDQYNVVGRAVHESSMGTEYGLEGEYYSGPNTFRAGFGVYDPKGAKNVYNYALGYQYNFSKRTYTWVEGQYTDLNRSGNTNGFKALVGIRHDF